MTDLGEVGGLGLGLGLPFCDVCCMVCGVWCIAAWYCSARKAGLWPSGGSLADLAGLRGLVPSL